MYPKKKKKVKNFGSSQLPFFWGPEEEQMDGTESEGAPLAKEKIDLEIDHLIRPLIILTTTQHRMAKHG